MQRTEHPVLPRSVDAVTSSPRVWHWLVPIVLAAMAVLVVVTARTAQGTDLRAERRTELTDLILAEDDRVDDATATVESLRTQIDELNAESDDPTAQALVDQTKVLGEAAGLQPVTGPGLTVTLEDAPVPADGIPEGYLADDYVVHQQDLQAVVNALWAGGAEAMQVMDQRIISTSAVRCVGNTLILQGRVYAPPFTVSAIGPVDRMQRALDASPGVAVYQQYVDLIGLGYTVDTDQTLTIVGYEGPLQLQHAEAAS